MDTGKILLIKLSPQFEEASALVGSVVIAQLLLTAFSRADVPVEDRRPFHLYCDEFQRFATSDFATMINESKNLVLSRFYPISPLHSLTQPPASLAAAGLLVVFR